MSNLTTEQRIEKAHVKIMSHEATRAYSSIIMVGDTSVSETFRTAYTNGRDKVYGRAFVDSLNDKELVGLILHESGHVMWQHGYMWKGLWKKNARLANQAADYVINLDIDKMAKKYPDTIALPKGALLDYRFDGMDTQQVFLLLEEEQESGNEGEEGEKSDKAEDGTGGEGQGEGDSGHGGFDEHDFGDLTEEQREELRSEVESAIRQGALLAGKMGGDMPRAFKDLTAPAINWEDQLRQFMMEQAAGRELSTWRKPNRRWLQYDQIMPSTYSERLRSIAIVADTSGSVDEELLSVFFAIVVDICGTALPEQLHLIACDAMVQSHDVYTEHDYNKLCERRELRGGGGTNMCAALNYIDENHIDPQVVVVLTDGYTPWPTELKCPTLWVITTPGVNAPVGVSIHVDTRRR